MSGLRARLFEHLQALSMGFHARSAVGDLTARFSTDMENVERALTQGIQGLVQAVAGIVVGLVVMFALEWKLSLASIATWVVFVVGPGLIGPKAAKASYQRQEDVGRVSSAVQENLVGQAVVKVFGLSASPSRKASRSTSTSSSGARPASVSSRRSTAWPRASPTRSCRSSRWASAACWSSGGT